MEWIRVLWSRCTEMFRKQRLDAELDEEVRAHIELATEENLRRGMRADEARRAALIAFGGVAQTREAHRRRRGIPFVRQLGRDFWIAARQLRKSPGFTLVALATLALGIGSVSSVFSVVDTVLLKPFPFADPGRLVVVREVEEEASRHMAVVPDNYRHFLRLKRDAKTIADAAIFFEPLVSVSPGGDRPQIVSSVKSSINLPSVLGVYPILGRGFIASDEKRGAPQVVMLTYTGWQSLFAGDPHVVGKTLLIGGFPATVIGVLGPEMRMPRIAMAPNLESGVNIGTREPMLFEPLIPSNWDLTNDVGNLNYIVIARLRPDLTISQATAELETLQRAYAIAARLPVHFGISVVPLAEDVTAKFSRALWFMFAAVSGVLLIACVNLANLQLARAVTAERETAVRAALGGSRSRLVMARLAESVLLTVTGGLAGAALATFGVRIFVGFMPANIPRLSEVRVDIPVLIFAAGVSIAAALVFGMVPALFSLRVQPQAALQGNTNRAPNSREGLRTRTALVTAQVACTVVLLIVTALALRSVSHLLEENRGFDSSHVTVAQIDLFAPQYSDKQRDVGPIKLAFTDRTLAALRRLPGVESVGLTSAMPMTGETWIDNLERPDHPVPAAQQPLVNARWINEDYLPSMRIPLLAGRNFDFDDRANPYVALISEKTAQVGFAGENPIGRLICDIVPNSQHAVTVVGVVADSHVNGLKVSSAMVYMPYWIYTPWTISFLVRSSQPSDVLIPEIRRAVWSIDSKVAIPVLKSMDEQVMDSVEIDRFQALILSSFGTAALLLALLGIYGVLAYSVSMRRREFGIRIAMGSGRAALIELVLRQAACPVVIGMGIGLGLSLAIMRSMRSLLYEAPAVDPVAIGGSLLFMAAAAALAAALPARRAASTDPMRALRVE